MAYDEMVEVAIVGGGIFGASIAWHLTRAGVRDVLVIERNGIGSGATARSAGLVSRGRTDPDILAMVRRTRKAIRELEAAIGEPVGFHGTGSLRLAATAETAHGLERMRDLLVAEGVEVLAPTRGEAEALVPWLNAGAAKSIIHVPDDGYLDAYLLTSAYVSAARAQGATFWIDTAATAPIHDGNRIIGVETARGRIGCRWLVDAAGAWAGLVAGWLGVAYGATPVRSHYWITAPDPMFPRDHPVVVLSDVGIYTRSEGGGLLIGIQEKTSKTYDARRLPPDIADLVLTGEEDWDILIEQAPAIKRYIPRFDDFRFAHHIAGLATYTPDGRFLIGSYPRIEGFLIAAGCCGTGVSVSGGIGAAIADMIVGRPSEIDLTRFRPDRFGARDSYSDAFMTECAAARANKGRRA